MLRAQLRSDPCIPEWWFLRGRSDVQSHNVLNDFYVGDDPKYGYQIMSGTYIVNDIKAELRTAGEES